MIRDSFYQSKEHYGGFFAVFKSMIHMLAPLKRVVRGNHTSFMTKELNMKNNSLK